MDTSQIDYVLKQHPSIRTYYGGTYPSDALPRDIGLDKQCFVVNVDPRSQPGSHWVAFYFEGGKGEFFDSYGNEPSFYSKRFTTFLQRNSVSWIYNSKRVQGTLSTVCGQYCIFYNLKRCQGYTLTPIVSAFGNDFNKNDSKINNWFNRRYGSSFPVHDVSFVLSQVAKSLSI
nr:TPA_asm: adenain [Strongylocentrotus sea urchin adintovirus]